MYPQPELPDASRSRTDSPRNPPPFPWRVTLAMEALQRAAQERPAYLSYTNLLHPTRSVTGAAWARYPSSEQSSQTQAKLEPDTMPNPRPNRTLMQTTSRCQIGPSGTTAGGRAWETLERNWRDDERPVVKFHFQDHA